MPFVPVGNPRNASDPATASGTSNYGSVSYTYGVGKYDVTVSQYVMFLNAVDPAGLNILGLFNYASTDAEYGVAFNPAAPNGSKYLIKPGYDNMPVVDVTYWDTIRFANWLNNGEGSWDTESGAYILQGGMPTPSNSSTVTRYKGAAEWVPNENEWYKAAFYDPALNAGAGGYWMFPTQNNSAPGNIVGSVSNEANYFDPESGLYCVTQSATYASGTNYLTPVGSFINCPGYYGTYDQAGDAWNLLEDQNVRSGSWHSDDPEFLDSFGLRSDPLTQGSYDVGFRVACSGTVAAIAAPAYRVSPAAVSGTAIMLSAGVNPNGVSGPATNPGNVLVSWQYGLIPGSYTGKTAAAPIETGSNEMAVSSITLISDLKVKGIYHYQLVISSALGDTYGPDQIFSVAPAGVAYSAPAAMGTGGETLSLTINPNGVDTTVSVEYGLTGAYTSGTIPVGDVGGGLTPVSVSPALAGLAADTIYHYRVVTTNQFGTYYGPDETFATAPLFGTAAVVSMGDSVPGIAGAIFSAFDNPAINDFDDTAFEATITGTGIKEADTRRRWCGIRMPLLLR
jgi:formylglycine-generating enzyme required for sulfatase activity